MFCLWKIKYLLEVGIMAIFYIFPIVIVIAVIGAIFIFLLNKFFKFLDKRDEKKRFNK